MHLKIKKYLNSTFGINEYRVWDFPSAIKENFSNCNFIWIDWDTLKNKVYPTSQQPKSCDVIKFQESSIDFIEFKTIKITDSHSLDIKIVQYDLTKKLLGSYEMTKELLNDAYFDLLDKENLKNINKVFCISFYIIWYTDPRKRLAMSMKVNLLKKSLNTYFIANPVPFWENFVNPKLFSTTYLDPSMDTLDAYYSP